MLTATGSTEAVAPQRVERLRPVRRRPGRSRSCCDRGVPADRSDTHGTRAAAPAGRTTHRNMPHSPPTDPQPADTPHEPPAPHHSTRHQPVQHDRAKEGYEGDKIPLVVRPEAGRGVGAALHRPEAVQLPE